MAARKKKAAPIHTLPEDALREMLVLLEAKTKLETREAAQNKFLPFVHHVYENFIEGKHHRIIAEKLEAVAQGKIKRLIVNMPPRHSKSEFASFLMPAWFLGRNPKLKVIQTTHNTELAVRFGRKVRDLIDDPQYAEIFPKTTLKEDSKSAGRWSTSEGGEYFACLTLDAPVDTETGPTPAGLVRVGDRLRTAHGLTTVLAVYQSTHDATVFVGGITCSKNHPIWTMNRGWVEAGELDPADILCVESIWDKLRGLFGRREHGPLEHPHVSPLVQHALSVRKPEKRQVSALRCARDYGLRALAGFRELLAGHGPAAVLAAHHRPDRGGWSLLPRQLPLGYPAHAVEQQTHQRAAGGRDVGRTRPQPAHYAGGSSIQTGQGLVRDRGVVPAEAPKSEVGDYGPPENLGRLRRWAAQVLGRSGRGHMPGEPGVRSQGGLARLRGWAEHIQGVLLGVRPAGTVRIEEHGPRPFVNYRVDGDNTFFVAGVLTHNCGVGAAVTGRGADLFIIDDAHSEQDALSDTAFDNAYEWYTSGPRQRLQPGGAIIVVMTRWGKKDLTGRLLANQTADSMADQWEVVEFPAIMPSGSPLWPEFWDKDALLSIKGSLPPSKWEAQWQQNPTASGSTVIRREWWKIWEKDKIPPLKYIIQAYDTAFSKKETADYSAITTWGVFEPEEGGKEAIMLLDAQRGRWNFPELKEVAFEEHQYWEPDMVIVEAKASGIPLIDELQARGIPAMAFSPGRRTRGRGGVDKSLRMHLCSPLFEAGMVWAPQDKRFAEEVIDEVSSFPNGDHDDFCDSMTLALLRFRQGGFIRIHEEEEDSLHNRMPAHKREYY